MRPKYIYIYLLSIPSTKGGGGGLTAKRIRGRAGSRLI